MTENDNVHNIVDSKLEERKKLVIDTLKDMPDLLSFYEHGRVLTGINRQVLFEAGDLADRIYLLVDGNIQVYTNNDDHELVLNYLNGVNFFGEMGFVGQESRRSASIRCRTDCTYIEMEYTKFKEFVKEHPTILKTLCEHMARRLKHTTQQVSSMAFDDVHDRVIETIFQLGRAKDAMTHSKGILIRSTRQEIANMLGCSRETVGRVIKALEEKGLIFSRGKTIVIHYPRSYHDLLATNFSKPQETTETDIIRKKKRISLG
ncbi:cyclic nucleotide-binding domain-containing protein [Psittacicella gerlachiana]|uniref:CRP/FNR family cyclic AMP-dependent transcriptional regulator n=1 Tax=Psittacicella gerlachiana TaxID=2028574 RepID=A0A3A1YMM2_9GAMM|nr:cyclic nucleotide-binding domain-containing protein [Psittacicella gerlachiana]RIY37514.1 hypothetical protein CKF59_01560 [Psittacicella gerlachiana]